MRPDWHDAAGYLCSSVLGRVATVVNSQWQQANARRPFGLSTVLQTALFVFFVAVVHGAVLPLHPLLAVPLVVLFSFLHGESSNELVAHWIAFV
eukprot:3884913-Pyramimonas_sp.AAC.1